MTDIHDRARAELQALRDAVLVAALNEVPFDGWSQAAITRAETKLGASLGPKAGYRAFPGGPAEMAEHASDYFDRRMLARLNALDLDAMKIRERVAAGVRARIEAAAPYREASRRLLAFLALPGNKPMAIRLAWRSCDLIWYAAGDNATDFNHYTKRGLLFPVYTTTILYWLSDQSEGYADTWGYLDRRIADVLKIPGYQAKIKKAFDRLPWPFKRPGPAPV